MQSDEGVARDLEVDVSALLDNGILTRNRGRSHELVIFEGEGDDRPFTYTIDYIRASFVDNTSFEPTGTATGGGGDPINEGISETIDGLNLNQFYGVDDGED